ncbi:MAG TPA: prolipoprotein diacylglyceryl transferase family protein [Candidatus Limnocylindrales bacterium]|nr:prolipoprotein diacylglyceryl transferase family protein [Candidatus Limnocylindrales bacterium]
MIEIPFAPDLVLGPVRVAWHSIFSFVGLMVGSYVSIRCARYLVRDERVYPFALAVVVGGLVSARAGHIVDNWATYEGDVGRMLSLGDGGIAVTAAAIGSSIAGLIAAKALRLPLGFMFDISVIGIAIGLAIGRIGDVINGEHWAAACSGLPWCVRYTHPETLGQTHFVHPVVAYDLLWDLVIFAVTLAYWRRVRGHPPEGRVYWLHLVLYGGGRLVSSGLRLDPVVLAGWQEAQIIGLGYVLAGVPMLLWLTRRERRRRAGAGAVLHPR